MLQKYEINLTAPKKGLCFSHFGNNSNVTVMRQLLRLRQTQMAVVSVFARQLCNYPTRSTCGICLVVTDLPRSASSASNE